jgi:hypothetical protein
MKRTGSLTVFAVTSLLCAFAAPIGCGGDTNTSGSTTVTRETFVTQFAGALCDAAASCCGARSQSASASCDSLLTADYQAALQGVLDDPAVSLDTTLGAQCIESIRALAGQCGASFGHDGGTDVCSRVLTGTLAEGATCKRSIECARGEGERASCDAPSGASGTVCIVVTLGKPGDACQPPGTVPSTSTHRLGCEELTTYCDATTSTCKALAAEGETCSSTFDFRCAAGLYCSFDQASNASTCIKAVAAGQPCGTTSFCEENSYCDTTTALCTAKLRTGLACTDEYTCRSGHCDAGVCTSTVSDPDETVEDVPHACE